MRRSARRAASSLAAAVSEANPSSLALLSPQQGLAWSFGELDAAARSLAAGLAGLGYGKNSVAISDIPNVAENLLLQCALSHLGAAIATPPKDPVALATLCEKYDVKGIVCVDGTSPPLSLDQLRPLASATSAPTVCLEGTSPAARISFEDLLSSSPRGDSPAASDDSLLGVFGGAALSQSAALGHGSDLAAKLEVSPEDRLCCSVTLMHAFGIGSACSAALGTGATLVLPAVGGIRGCGNPVQRASVTLEVLASTKATVLVGDTHTLRAMAGLPAPSGLALRTGAIKIGSGSTFLDGVREAPPGPKGGEPLPLEYAGVPLHAIGKAAS